MKFRPNKKQLHIGIMALAVIILSICFYYLLFHGSRFQETIGTITQIAMPIIYGIVFAYLLTPIVNRIEGRALLPLIRNGSDPDASIPVSHHRKKLIRVVSIFCTMVIVSLTFYGFFSMVIPRLVESIRSISTQFPLYAASITGWVNNFGLKNPAIMTFINDNISKYSAEIQNYLNTNIIPQMEMVVRSVSLSLIGFFKILWNFLIGIIISVYVLYNKELFAGQAKKMIYAMLKTKTANTFIQSTRFTSKTFSGFISGKIIDSIIIGFLCFAGTSLIGTPYPVLISVIVGVTNIIPFFGPYMGAIPSAFLILMVDPIQCLYFAVFILVLQQFDGNFLGPRILGESTGLSGFWIIFSITIFGGIFGVLGMVIGVPIFAVLYAGVKGYIGHKLRAKGLSADTVDYMDVGSIDGTVFIKNQPPQKNARSFLPPFARFSGRTNQGVESASLSTFYPKKNHKESANSGRDGVKPGDKGEEARIMSAEDHNQNAE